MIHLHDGTHITLKRKITAAAAASTAQTPWLDYTRCLEEAGHKDREEGWGQCRRGSLPRTAVHGRAASWHVARLRWGTARNVCFTTTHLGFDSVATRQEPRGACSSGATGPTALLRRWSPGAARVGPGAMSQQPSCQHWARASPKHALCSEMRPQAPTREPPHLASLRRMTSAWVAHQRRAVLSCRGTGEGRH